jgi:hypothetical protein
MQLDWLMEQIDLYCAQNAEEVAAEEDSTMTYKAAYKDCLEFVYYEKEGYISKRRKN